jgi:hypothetical protein
VVGDPEARAAKVINLYGKRCLRDAAAGPTVPSIVPEVLLLTPPPLHGLRSAVPSRPCSSPTTINLPPAH